MLPVLLHYRSRQGAPSPHSLTLVLMTAVSSRAELHRRHLQRTLQSQGVRQGSTQAFRWNFQKLLQLLMRVKSKGQQPSFALKISLDCKWWCRYFNNGWGRVQSSLWHFMRIQSQFINLVAVEVLPPYMPSQEEKQDPRVYADNVRRWGASTASSRQLLANSMSIVWPGSAD